MPLQMHLQRPTHDDFDKWLTELPEEALRHLSAATNQTSDNTPENQTTLAHIFSLILHFCGKPALAVNEIAGIFPAFTMCLALEILVRDGDVMKEGTYSLVPGYHGAQFSMTEQGTAKKKLE
jgi:hypothetical protein